MARVDVAVSMANESEYTAGVSLEDKLRLAASKGQVERIPELLANGATYQPDRVTFTLVPVSRKIASRLLAAAPVVFHSRT